jgi:hypothetical protein
MFIDEPHLYSMMLIYVYIYIYLFIWDWLNPHELYVMYDVTTLCWDISRLLRFLRPQIPVDYIQFTRAGVGIDRSLVTGRTSPCIRAGTTQMSGLPSTGLKVIGWSKRKTSKVGHFLSETKYQHIFGIPSCVRFQEFTCLPGSGFPAEFTRWSFNMLK